MILFKIAGTALVTLAFSFILLVALVLTCQERNENPSGSVVCRIVVFIFLFSAVMALLSSSIGFIIMLWR